MFNLSDKFMRSINDDKRRAQQAEKEAARNDIINLLCSSQLENIELAKMLCIGQGWDITKLLADFGYLAIGMETPEHFLRNNITITNSDLSYFPRLPDGLKFLHLRFNQRMFKLPVLPNSLESLNCEHNNHLRIVSTLPNSLQFATFRYNDNLENISHFPESLTWLKIEFCKKIETLPNLPSMLEILACEGNSLKELPRLPYTLRELYCGSNNLKNLPKILPPQLRALHCEKNKLTQLPLFFPDSMERAVFAKNPFNPKITRPMLQQLIPNKKCFVSI
jgi:hypothetical protein